MGHLQRCVSDFSRFFTKDGTQQTFFRRQLRLALRCHFSDQDIPRADLGADTDNTALIQILQGIFADTRNISCDLFRSQLRISGFCFVFFNMNGRINVFLYETLAQQDSILVVISFPCHKSDQRILSEGQLTLAGGRSVRDHLSGFHTVIFVYNRLLIVAVALIASREFRQMVHISGAIVTLDDDFIGRGTLYDTAVFCHHADAGVHRRLFFHTGSHHWRFRQHQRHGLTLHVGSHQRTVGIVILQERNHGCRHREHHLRRYVHQIDLLFLKLGSLFTETAGYIVADKVAVLIQRFVGLCHHEIVFFVGSQVYDFIGYSGILRIRLVHLTVRSLHKSILIDSRIRRQRVDQTNVRTFRRFNGTHSSVMGIVNIADLEPGTVSGETAWSQCGQTSLMCQLGQRIILIHKLRQLGTSEEFLHSSRHRLNIDQ